MTNSTTAAQPLDLDKQRDLFEAGELDSGSNLTRQADGQYENPCTQSAWEGWQNALIAQARTARLATSTWDAVALAVDEAEKNGLDYVKTELLRKLLARTRTAQLDITASASIADDEDFWSLVANWISARGTIQDHLAKVALVTYIDCRTTLAPVAAKPASPANDEIRQCVRDAVAGALTGLYYCGRVWSAWSVGTMSEDDFLPANEDDDIIENVTDAAISAMGLAATVPAISQVAAQQAAAVAAPSELTREALAQMLAGKHVNDYGYRMLLNGEEIGFNLSDLLEIVKLAAPTAGAATSLTVENAPIGTVAPSIGGGHWYRTESGWKWNGPDGSGGTFPHPGATGTAN